MALAALSRTPALDAPARLALTTLSDALNVLLTAQQRRICTLLAQAQAWDTEGVSYRSRGALASIWRSAADLARAHGSGLKDGLGGSLGQLLNTLEPLVDDGQAALELQSSTVASPVDEPQATPIGAYVAPVMTMN